jgi:hypothetical protein
MKPVYIVLMLVLLAGCINVNVQPAWVDEVPEVRPCGPPTRFFEYADRTLEGSFDDVFRFPGGVLFCAAGHSEEDDPRPGEQGKVTVITFALTNPMSVDYPVGRVSDKVRTSQDSLDTVGYVGEGHIRGPSRVEAGQTVMMRFVYELAREDWSTAYGVYRFSEGMQVAMLGLE